MKDGRLRGICFSPAICMYKTEKRKGNLMDVENREILFCDFHVS